MNATTLQEIFQLSCDGLGEPIGDDESAQMLFQRCGPSGEVSFDDFVAFVLRRRAFDAAPPATTVASAPSGRVTVTVKRRGVAARVRVNGPSGTRATVFGIGFEPGSQIFSDAPHAAAEVPALLRPAKYLPLPKADVTGDRSDYVTFVPLVELRVFVIFQDRECVPAWLRRDFRHTNLMVTAVDDVPLQVRRFVCRSLMRTVNPAACHSTASVRL